MSYFSEIFDRANIQNIREFLLHGVECDDVSDKPYIQRIDASRKLAIAMVESKFPDMEEKEEITGMVYDYASETQNVYMEVGLQCGTFIALELLRNFSKKD